MKTDPQLKADVTAELHWEPAVNAANVGVAVKDGIVNLSGTLETHAEKLAAERAVRRVAGVRGIAMDIEVRLSPGHRRSDMEIAKAVADALAWHSLIPEDRVQAAVEDGWVTLTGEVDWGFQQASAEQCVQPLVGVRGLTNRISVKARPNAKSLSAEIEAAFERHARREARHIHVRIDGGIVTLEGKVDSLADHEAAIGTAWGTQGVTRVVDRLRVGA
jgi:osmotically-inducible protein OsmY